MKDIIEVNGTYEKNDVINFKVVKTTYTGSGALDYKQETLDTGRTERMFNTDDCDEQAFDYFKEKYAQDGFEFDCFIN